MACSNCREAQAREPAVRAKAPAAVAPPTRPQLPMTSLLYKKVYSRRQHEPVTTGRNRNPKPSLDPLETKSSSDQLTPPPLRSSSFAMETPKTLAIREEPAAPGAAAGGPAAGGGFVAALKELVEPKDRRIQASAFFLFCGSSVVLHGTVFNLADNPEHVLVGYGLYTIGAAIGFFTLSGSDRLGRAAARVEEVLRGLFQ